MANLPWKTPYNAIVNVAHSIPGFNNHAHPYTNLPDQGVPLYQPQQQQLRDQATDYNPKQAPKSRTALKRYKELRRRLYIVSCITQILSGIFALFLEGAMSYVLYKYYTTNKYGNRNDYNTDKQPWPKNPKLWPTVMLLAASAVTFLLSIGLLLALCCRSKKKIVFSSAYFVIHVGAWIAIAALYRLGKSDNDLWGWTCGKGAKQLQKLFQNDINFDALCKVQGSSWKVSIAEVGVKTICFATAFHFYIKQSRLKSKIAESLGDDSLEMAET